METKKILTILVFVFVPVLASNAYGKITLTVDNQDVSSITLQVDQSCTVEVVSSDSTPYEAYIGFYGAPIIGDFSPLEIKPEAGKGAAVAKYSTPGFRGYHVMTGSGFPPPSPGIHFVFQFEAQEVGETDIKLFDDTLKIELDSLHITVIPAPMGTAFTYQGRLLDDNNPTDGPYDFEFKLYDSPVGGNQLASTIDINDLDVIDGYFTVQLDFNDANVFNGDARWLQVGVRPGDSNDPNSFVSLSPRQEITPVPYALQTRGIFVDNSGNIGIGTTSPGAKLEVLQSTWSDIIKIGTDFAANANRLILSSGSQWASISGSTTNRDDIVIKHSNGNVGIGTTNPAGQVGLGAYQGGTAASAVAGHNKQLVLGGEYNTGFNTGSSVKLLISDYDNDTDANIYPIYCEDEQNRVDFYVRKQEGSVSTAYFGGNVGIGTKNPRSKLSVGGDGDSYVSIYGAGSYTGVRGTGTYTGVKGYVWNSTGEDITAVKAEAGKAGLDWANAYGVYSKVTRNGYGNYWSGYFVCSGGLGNYNGLYADTRTGGAVDLAEYILDTFGDTEPGDVLVADPDNNESAVKSTKPFDSSVVGIVSTKPHMVIGIELIMDEETGQIYENVKAAQLALVGRIPVKVTDENGPIQRGDLLTTSSRPGYAMKWNLLDVDHAKDFEELRSILAENQRRHHAVVGKALESHETGDGKVIALLSLQ